MSDNTAVPVSMAVTTAVPAANLATIPVREVQTGFQPVNVEMVTENGVLVLRKTFETAPGFDPLTLMENLDNSSYTFSCREILRRELPGELLSRPASKVAVVRMEQDDTEAVARTLPATLEYEENGYTGLLYLDASSISTEPEDFESYTCAHTDTQEIGGLPRNDPSYLDKELNGMTLTGVSFKQGQDGQYTATAAYQGTATGKRPVSHVATATYLGEITMEVPGSIQYTVVYEGTPVAQPTPVPAPVPVPATPIESTESAPMPEETAAETAESAPPEPEAEPEPVPEPPPYAPIPQVYVITLVAAAVIFLIGAVVVPLYTIKQNKKEREASNETLEEIRQFIRSAA